MMNVCLALLVCGWMTQGTLGASTRVGPWTLPTPDTPQPAPVAPGETPVNVYQIDILSPFTLKLERERTGATPSVLFIDRNRWSRIWLLLPTENVTLTLQSHVQPAHAHYTELDVTLGSPTGIEAWKYDPSRDTTLWVPAAPTGAEGCTLEPSLRHWTCSHCTSNGMRWDLYTQRCQPNPVELRPLSLSPPPVWTSHGEGVDDGIFIRLPATLSGPVITTIAFDTHGIRWRSRCRGDVIAAGTLPWGAGLPPTPRRWAVSVILPQGACRVLRSVFGGWEVAIPEEDGGWTWILPEERYRVTLELMHQEGHAAPHLRVGSIQCPREGVCAQVQGDTCEDPLPIPHLLDGDLTVALPQWSTLENTGDPTAIARLEAGEVVLPLWIPRLQGLRVQAFMGDCPCVPHLPAGSSGCRFVRTVRRSRGPRGVSLCADLWELRHSLPALVNHCGFTITRAGERKEIAYPHGPEAGVQLQGPRENPRLTATREITVLVPLELPHDDLQVAIRWNESLPLDVRWIKGTRHGMNATLSMTYYLESILRAAPRVTVAGLDFQGPVAPQELLWWTTPSEDDQGLFLEVLLAAPGACAVAGTLTFHLLIDGSQAGITVSLTADNLCATLTLEPPLSLKLHLHEDVFLMGDTLSGVLTLGGVEGLGLLPLQPVSPSGETLITLSVGNTTLSHTRVTWSQIPDDPFSLSFSFEVAPLLESLEEETTTLQLTATVKLRFEDTGVHAKRKEGALHSTPVKELSGSRTISLVKRKDPLPWTADTSRTHQESMFFPWILPSTSFSSSAARVGQALFLFPLVGLSMLHTIN